MSDTVQQTATSVRLREATAEDVDFIAWVLLAASRSHLPVGIWEYVCSLSEDRALRYLELVAVAEPVHFCHYSTFLIAEVDGEAAAALCGFDPEKEGHGALGAVLPSVTRAAGITMDATPGIAERSAIVGSVSPEHESGAWIVENVATLPRFRRRGLVDGLLAAMLDRGRSRGFDLAQIGVFIGNDPARAAYIKAGFAFADEKRDAAFEAALGCAGIERLRRLI